MSFFSGPFFSALSASPTGRHAKRSIAPGLAVTGLAAVFVSALTGTASAASSAQDLARLRGCESGGNYAINTGNGYYGAYQFDIGTWQGLGYPGRADQASPATQDEAAARLQSQRGWSPWPGCTSRLGLGQGGGSTATSPASPATSTARPARASRGGQRSALVPSSTPVPFDGQVITTADVARDLATVRAWQGRMAKRGWDIGVDGRFGPQSAGVAARFAAEKGLRPMLPGSVDRAVYTGAWTIAVS